MIVPKMNYSACTCSLLTVLLHCFADNSCDWSVMDSLLQQQKVCCSGLAHLAHLSSSANGKYTSTELWNSVGPVHFGKTFLVFPSQAVKSPTFSSHYFLLPNQPLFLREVQKQEKSFVEEWARVVLKKVLIYFLRPSFPPPSLQKVKIPAKQAVAFFPLSGIFFTRRRNLLLFFFLSRSNRAAGSDSRSPPKEREKERAETVAAAFFGPKWEKW